MRRESDVSALTLCTPAGIVHAPPSPSSSALQSSGSFIIVMANPVYLWYPNLVGQSSNQTSERAAVSNQRTKRAERSSSSQQAAPATDTNQTKQHRCRELEMRAALPCARRLRL